MGTVYRARDLTSGRTVAIKTLQNELYAARFEREASVLSELEHPAIVRYVAHGLMADQEPYLAMEWLVGEDLAVRLERGPLPVDETLTLARRLSGALADTHARGIV